VLYLGYVGFVVPFAFGIAALIRRHVGIEWVTAVRRWVLFAWTMLTTGIIFGGYWAYYELGWGGYWAWDPVENASLMPWLTGTALLHSMMAQEKRQMFRLWNMFLVISTFLLTLLGTFLVRSGVLTSVHSFASDPERGTYILIFLGGAMLAGYGLLIWRAETLESDAAVESPFSREAGLLANNVLLLIAAATVVIGTLFPLAVEVITGDKISVGAPYFNAVIVPIMVGVMFLMAIGPSVPWRRMDPARFARQFGWPLAFGGVGVAVALWAGVVDPVSLAAILAVGFAALATLEDLRRSVAARMRVTGEWAPRAALSVLRLGRRRIGGLIVHLGIVILAAGMIGSGLFQEARTVHLRVGQSTETAGHVLTLREVSNISGPNWTGRAARLSVARDGVPMAEMVPEKRFYTIRAMATTETAIEGRWAGDLYVFMGDELDGGLVMQIYWNPLVRLVWLGWLVIFLGAGLSLTQPRLAAAAPRARPLPNEGVPAE
jgi:cytochrome c-type biogenesis protein CcmF